MPEEKRNKENRISTFVINLVASAINGTTPNVTADSSDWDEIIEFAKKQSVLNIIAYSCEKLQEKPDAKTMKFLKEFRMQKMVVEAQQEIEFCDAMDKLEKMQIKHMPLKGYIVKNLYPSPDMRTMGDLDILVEKEKCDEIVAAFVSDGFTNCADGDLHSNVERGNAYIEFHRSMVNEKHETLSAYFGDGFSRAKLSDGYSFRYELAKEDLYIFLIAHIAKHYRYGGTGIRSLLDLYVYRRAYPEMDYDYIRSELEKINLRIFQEKIEKIADDWYSGNFDGEFDTVSSYIISGGVYGTESAPLLNTFIQDNQGNVDSRTKARLWFQTVFPGKELMTTRYPILKKCIFLLPFFWIIRFFDTLIRTPQNFRRSVRNTTEILKIDDALVNAQRDSGIDKL
ncbi:MAG: nucleotidyltransferase family protein [Clostridia bacterium]|nr:nucleotidyltransferase family protein [Clostridia bacterium]